MMKVVVKSLSRTTSSSEWFAIAGVAMVATPALQFQLRSVDMESDEKRDDGLLGAGDRQQAEDERFFKETAVPAPKRQRSGSICTRLELLLAGAVVVLTLIRRGLPITSDEIIDGCGLLPRYRYRVGLKRVMSDALGYGDDDCAKLWRDRADAVLAVRENVSLLRKALLPRGLWPSVLERASWSSEAELAAFAKTLPSAVGG